MTIPGNDKWKMHLDQDFHWQVDDDRAYLVRDGKMWPIKAIGICANGTRDLCIARDDEGELIIAKIESTPPEKVLDVPDADIGIFEFYEEIPSLGGKLIILGMDPSFDELIRHIIQRFPSLKMDQYDAYLCKDYSARR